MIPSIAIFDVGKTNKKIMLFNEQYQLLHEENKQLRETVDEDGFPCEDVNALTAWLTQSLQSVLSNTRYDLKAINFAAYGASFVHLDEHHKPITALYNYLKPYPADLKVQFYNKYGGEALLARQTASPILGSLNSGLQLYRLKYEKPEIFGKIKYSLHLPQYLSFLVSKKLTTDISSVGCHTHLWDFERNEYHAWVLKENMLNKFAAIHRCDEPVGTYTASDPVSRNIQLPVGTGLHDSSAALIPYIASFHEPFVLISTGTWCISLNPFNHLPLTDEELAQDCLCYLSYQGKPVKASRLFAGYEHEQHARRMADHFHTAPDHYENVKLDIGMLDDLRAARHQYSLQNLSSFSTYEQAYHAFMLELTDRQIRSTTLVINGTDVKRIFVDGGFSKNKIFMHLLADAFPGIEVYAASVPQSTALGAALSIHRHWNKNDIRKDLIALEKCRI